MIKKSSGERIKGFEECLYYVGLIEELGEIRDNFRKLVLFEENGSRKKEARKNVSDYVAKARETRKFESRYVIGSSFKIRKRADEIRSQFRDLYIAARSKGMV